MGTGGILNDSICILVIIFFVVCLQPFGILCYSMYFLRLVLGDPYTFA